MLQHVTRSRGWNITERVNGNVGNEIELGTEIPTIKSRILQSIVETKGIGHQRLWQRQNTFVGIHRDHHRRPYLIDDHLPERSIGNV
jgi:hypothetical protein